MSKSPTKADVAAADTGGRLDNTGVLQPMSAGVDVKPWSPPMSDQQFVFTGLDAAPGWVDRNWAGFDRGPALQLPAGDIYGKAPYTTKTARLGDTVIFKAAAGGKPAHFEVVEGLPTVESGIGTIKPAQQSNASLEDMLRGGSMSVADLGTDAKAQVSGRSPELARHIEDGVELAPQQELPVKAKPE